MIQPGTEWRVQDLRDAALVVNEKAITGNGYLAGYTRGIADILAYLLGSEQPISPILHAVLAEADYMIDGDPK